MKTSGRNSRILTTVRRGFSSTRVGLAAKRAGSCGMPVKLSSGCAGIDARFTACIWPRLRVGKGAVGETGAVQARPCADRWLDSELDWLRLGQICA